MSDTLWIQVSDEVSLPGRLLPAEEARLAAIFDGTAATSPWCRALSQFGLKSSQQPLIRFAGGTPYFNASALAAIVSHGAAWPEPGAAGVVTYRGKAGILSTLKQLRSQWKVEAYLARLPEDLPAGERAIAESVALGIVLQLLRLRLPLSHEAEFARWLTNLEEAPAAQRGTLRKILDVQGRRTKLSPAWATLYEKSALREKAADLAPYFWNEPISPRSDIIPQGQLAWQGIPIAPGLVEAPIVFLDNPVGAKLPEVRERGCILIFAKARPETVELFPQAAALVFAEGGALAHACCVAREQNIPCVSGLGREFLAQLRLWNEQRVRLRAHLDGERGRVQLEIMT